VEKQALKQVSKEKKFVVACGGGIVLDADNIKIMKETGIIVCLTSSPEAICKRTSACATRPLLNVKDPKKQIEHLLKMRAPYYAKADKIIDTSKLSVKETAEKIIKKMNRLKALIGLNMFCDIGSLRLKKLLKFFGTPENILKASSEELTNVAGIGEKIAQKITSLQEKDIDEEMSLAEKQNLRIVTLDEEIYPANLKQIFDPPILLYVKGELKQEDKSSIGIVGSRRASLYGIASAEKFASDLAEQNFTIVSGLARGIDTASHKGALKAGGRTIAVIGSGFNYLYPAENKKLSDDIAEHGAVVSEFPMNAKPLPQNFPRRNRVISGLSLGVLVVEAARNSGALITADCALEQGREVFALPGKIDSQNSFGTNELIKQGAKLVSCADDIVEEFNGIQSVSQKEQKITKPQEVNKVDLSNHESLLYNMLSDKPLLLDEIADRTGFAIPQISGVLLKLQLRRLIKEVAGKQFIRA
jgi:DNA processing protein